MLRLPHDTGLGTFWDGERGGYQMIYFKFFLIMVTKDKKKNIAEKDL